VLDLEEEILLLEFTEFERAFYTCAQKDKEKAEQRMICCHHRIAHNSKRILDPNARASQASLSNSRLQAIKYTKAAINDTEIQIQSGETLLRSLEDMVDKIAKKRQEFKAGNREWDWGTAYPTHGMWNPEYREYPYAEERLPGQKQFLNSTKKELEKYKKHLAMYEATADPKIWVESKDGSADSCDEPAKKRPKLQKTKKTTLSLDDSEEPSTDKKKISNPIPIGLGVTRITMDNKGGEVSKTRIPYDEDTNHIINVQGTKLGHLVKYLIEIEAKDKDESDTRVIIFSQFSPFLHLISATLTANGISNEYCQGNVHVKSRIIQNFQDPTDEGGEEVKEDVKETEEEEKKREKRRERWKRKS